MGSRNVKTASPGFVTGQTKWENIYVRKYWCFNVIKPANKNHYQPDSEVDDGIWEEKIQTYYTSGTAGEKILGVPFKYAEIQVLYSKPLKILCMAGAEKVCREQYGNLDGGKCSDIKRAFLAFYKINGVEFVSATDILRRVAVIAD